MGAFSLTYTVSLEGVSCHTIMAVNICRQELNLELSLKEASFCCPVSFRSPMLWGCFWERRWKGNDAWVCSHDSISQGQVTTERFRKELINFTCVMIKEHSRLEALVIVGVSAGWTLGFDFGFKFLSYEFFLHKFPTGVHWYALKMLFFSLHKHSIMSLFHSQLHAWM